MLSGDLDRGLLAFLAAHELVLAQQAAALLHITETDAVKRLELLGEQRLLTRVTLTSRLPAGYRITHKGAEHVDPALPPLRALSPGRYRHEVAIAWLSAAASAGSLGELRACLTRRQMQAADTTGHSAGLLRTTGARFVEKPAAGSQPDARYAYPDLALIQAASGGGWASVEVMLTTPDTNWLRATLSRRHRDRLIRAQLYLVERDRQIEQHINTVVAELGIAEHVHIQFLEHDGIAGA